MKENSIEEDITRVKQRIEDVKEYIKYGLSYSEYLDLENSFDNILSDYKRVLKENEELKNKLSLKQFDINIVYNDYLEKLYKYEQNSIPIQKIKDKIKKNKNLVEESNDGDIIRKLNQENEVLQDLLEEEKQWEKYIKAGN